MAHTAFPYRNIESRHNHPSGLDLLWLISRLQAQSLGALKCYPSRPRSPAAAATSKSTALILRSVSEGMDSTTPTQPHLPRNPGA